METKHTPGPWKRDKYGTLTGADNAQICVQRIGLATIMSGDDNENALANDDLIAAAPELLAALKLIESVYRQNCVTIGEPSSVLRAIQDEGRS